MRIAVRKYAPYIDWEEMDSFKIQAGNQYNQFKDKLRNSNNSGSDMDQNI